MKAVLLGLAWAASVGGLALIALAMQTHWEQVRTDPLPAPAVRAVLRAVGVLGLLASWLLCLRADHATMAALVWVMLLAASALLVAFVLSWKPRLLALCVVWVPGSGRRQRARAGERS